MIAPQKASGLASPGWDHEDLIANRTARLRQLIAVSTGAETCALLEGINAAMEIALHAGGPAAGAIAQMRDTLITHANERLTAVRHQEGNLNEQ